MNIAGRTVSVVTARKEQQSF